MYDLHLAYYILYINPALVVDIDFNRPKRFKPTTLQKAPLQLQRSVTTRQKVFKVVDMQSILKSLHRANHSAAIFTVLTSVSTEARISQHTTLAVNEEEACYLEVN